MKKLLLAAGLFIAGMVLIGTAHAAPLATITVTQSPTDRDILVEGCGFHRGQQTVVTMRETGQTLPGVAWFKYADNDGCIVFDIAWDGPADDWDVAVYKYANFNWDEQGLLSNIVQITVN